MVDLDKFPKKLYRGDQSELDFSSIFYEQHGQYWVGYFDREKEGWVMAITARHWNEQEATRILMELLNDKRDRYFVQRPEKSTGENYDKSIVEEL